MYQSEGAKVKETLTLHFSACKITQDVFVNDVEMNPIEHLIAWDKKAFLWINNEWSTHLFDLFFGGFITWFGNAAVVIVLVSLFFALKGREYLREHLVWFLLAMALAGLCVYALKEAIARPRPLTEFAPQIKAGVVHVNVLGEHLKYRSFPSGDAQTAFTAATYLSLLVRGWSPLFFALALAVGISRIYMGVHFPLDVLAGALLGAIWGWLGWWGGKAYNKHLPRWRER